MIGERGLYTHIVRSLGATPRFHKANIILQATELLTAEQHERARTPILVVDEAHLLGCEQLEEIRMLTNHDLDTRSLFACLLLASPCCASASSSASWPPSTSASACATTWTA